MIFETVKSEGIAHKSYFIGSNGSAAVIDPRRDCDVYLEIAEKNNLQIEYIFETHRNEDYAIGSIELREIVNAEVYHGSQLDFTYGNSVCEGNKFPVSFATITVILNASSICFAHSILNLQIVLKSGLSIPEIYI